MKPPKLLRLVYPKNHSKTHFLHLSPFLFFTFFILLQASLIHAEIPLEYIKHCNGVVPVSPAEPTTLFPSPTTVSNNLDFKIGYFSGGDSIFFQSNTAVDVPKAATFSAQFSHDIFGSNKTRIYKVQGKLVLQIPKSFSLPSPNGGILNPRRGLRRQFRIRGPKIPVIGRGAPSFSLGGFWSESTGRLCMIGSGISNGNAGKMQVLLGFRNSSWTRNYFPFDPNKTLIGEGAWDEKKNSFCGVACRILKFGNSLNGTLIGDCSIKFSLRYPKVLSLRNRDSIVGKIWSDKNKEDPSYFDMIRFRSVWEVSPGLKNVPGLRYEYTEVDSARIVYASKHVAEHKGKTYPNADSIDMRFDMSVIDSKGESAWGIANPMFVGAQPYKYQSYSLLPLSFESAIPSNNDSRLLNISYQISYTYYSSNRPVLAQGFEISAEGVYDRHTGVLCMVGCKHVRYKNHSSIKTDSLDCDILVTIHFSPINVAEKYRVKGRIESTRIKSDPLYFGPINFSSRSFYAGQAKESIWRMDLEITMVLISNTLACLFVGMQLFHVKRHPEVLPFISVLMLVVLTLGHMIPLLLNFEALFVKNSNQQNAFLESGGWLEVNEIIVRAVTMVAFLLQFRLLQLTWSIRQGDDSQKGFWDAEKKALYVSLPLYLTGGLIAWFVHRWKNSHQTPFLQPHHKRLRMVPYQNRFYHQTSFWTDFKSYGGLILDGFLLPQILFNIFSKSNETALAASFYIGTTLVRLLPHAYDLYRAHSSSGYLDLSYIYANHKMDFYSTAWDIIIPCGGLLFAIFVFLQQRYGGQYLLPKRFRKDAVYEKVSVDNSEELQGETVQKNFYSL
ncbi:hypothetical protein V6Z12_A10G028800 [Gossypium hirsutum]